MCSFFGARGRASRRERVDQRLWVTHRPSDLDWQFRGATTLLREEIRRQRATRLGRGLEEWRKRFADRIFTFTEPAAIAYGALMGEASRSGRPMSRTDGMIAAIAKVNGGRLATRNTKDFENIAVELVSPWDF